MRKLIDIAGRTGQAPVRALLADAVGSTDPAILQPVEIRYRNDQYRVIYGLYDGDVILGLVGLVRNPGADSVEILHLAVEGENDRAIVTDLLRLTLARRRQRTVIWRSPGAFASVASDLGFGERLSNDEDSRWELRDGD